MPGIGHLSIDKNQIMQQKVISAIDAVVFSRRGETFATQKQPVQASAPEESSNRPEAAASGRD